MKLAAVSAVFATLLVESSASNRVVFRNHCGKVIPLWDNEREEPIPIGQQVERLLPVGWKGMFRSGRDPQATLAEFTLLGGKFWYDISIIPTAPGKGPDLCESLEACKRHTGGTGFNEPMQIAPQSNINGAHCRVLDCPHDGCVDAYQFPKDDTKTHNCPLGTEFVVTFCPGGPGSTPAPTPTPTPSPSPSPTTPAPTPSTPAPTNQTRGIGSPARSAGSSSSDGSRANSSVSFDQAQSENRALDDKDLNRANADREPKVHANNGVDAGTAGVSTPSSEQTAGGPSPSQPAAIEVNTKANSNGGGMVGAVVATLFALAAAVGVAVVVAVRRKKQQLDDANQKTPARLNESLM